MAQDWIKMRTDLYRDPRVCLMAEHLMDPDSDLAHYVNQNMQRDMTVTRNVMRNVTVGALLSIWGVMRVRGKAIGVDLVCRGVGIAVLDDIADLQGIGAAMESVGWVVETPEGIVFPRFFEENNVDPEAASKEKAAARQKRFRERQKQESDGDSDVTGDVTVTHREEKRREEKKDIAQPEAAPVFKPVAELKIRGVDEQVAQDWLKVRKAKRLPLTKTALDEVIREADKIGWPLHRAITLCCKRSWVGFDASWLKDSDLAPAGPAVKDYL